MGVHAGKYPYYINLLFIKIKGGDKEKYFCFRFLNFSPNSLGVILRKMENNPRKRAR